MAQARRRVRHGSTLALPPKSAQVPPIGGKRSNEDAENLSMETAAKLKAAGVPFALQSGYEGYVPKTRVVLFEAAIAATNGLGFDNALASITLDAAKILGIDARTGSLAPGKDADLALFDGDPFEYTTHCIGTIVGGEVFAEARTDRAKFRSGRL
jgi:imidazolonepropionase-like amidohydrolase